MSRICRGCGGILGRDCFHEQDCMWISDQQEMDYRRQQEQQQEQIDDREPPEPDWELLHYQHVTDELFNALKKAKETIKVMHGDVAWGIYDLHSPEMKIINSALESATNLLSNQTAPPRMDGNEK